jgi:hypothetical protein
MRKTMAAMQHLGRMGLPVLLLLWACPLCVRASEPDHDLVRQIQAAQVPLDKLEPQLRTKVADLLQNAPLFLRGPVESFPCRPNVYHWLLDQPEWAIHCWRLLGVCKATIARQPDGAFLGKDHFGSELRWRPILSESGRRIWYAEGSGRLAPLMPLVQLRAVVFLRYQTVQGEDGRIGIRHRVDMFAQYDSKTVDILSKLGGMSAESAGKKVLEQIGLFFSGMAWYLSEHPQWGQQTIQKQARQTGELERVAPLLSELAQAALEHPDKPTTPRKSRP